MNKPAKRAVAFSLSAMLAVNTVIVSIPVSAEENKGTTYTHDGYTIEYTVRNEWSGNQNIEITVTNTGSEILSDWAMGYNAYGEINGLWNAQIYGHQGTEYILKAADYNSEILPGQTINFGYTLSGDEFKIPQDIRNCAQRVDIADGFDVYYNIVGDYGSTYQAEIFIKNTSDADISAWNLSFDANAAIDNIWNGKIISKGESCYKVKNAENNHVIAAGKEVSFSFTGSRLDNEDDKNYDISFGNYKLTAMFIPMEFGFEIDPSLDTDNDGLPDYYENELGTDKNDPDTDGDMLPDGYEVFTLGTDPLKKDTDDNGVSDSEEDFDNDGLNNLREYNENTDPNNEDTDHDGLNDYDEIITHKSDPLKQDTDSDKVTDGDEVALGLDPRNDSTYGYPDSEYTTEQTVGDDNKALSRINDKEDNPYTISIDITAAGVAENNVHASESGYAYQISQNEAVLGIVPEIAYTDGLSVKDVTINFNIKDNVADIEDLVVFKYFDDNNVLLPIETSYDVAGRTVSTHVDEVGTYCLMDVVKWFEYLKDAPTGNFGEIGDNEPANIVFCLDTRNIVDEESFEQVKSDIKTITEDSFEKYSDIKVYVYYQRFGSNFKANHYLLKDEEGNSYFTDFEDVDKALDNVERYMIRSNKWAYDYVAASQFMINKCDDKIIAMYHITADDRVMGCIDSAKKLKQSVLTDMYTTSDDEDVQRIHISTLCPSSNEPFDTSSFAYEMAKISGGIAVSGFDILTEANDTDEEAVLFDNMNKISASPMRSLTMVKNTSSKKSVGYTVNVNLIDILGDGETGKYSIISSTGLTTIKLNNPLKKGSLEDKDLDGLTDWEEVNVDLIKTLYVKDNHTIPEVIKSSQLPRLSDCRNYYGDLDNQKVYVQNGYDILLNKNAGMYFHGDKKRAEEAIGKIRILPINSDPTKVDSDDDGIMDSLSNELNKKGYFKYSYDDEPLKKGLSNGVIGELSIVSCDNAPAGHGFLVYRSFVKDKFDFGYLAGGYKLGEWEYINTSLCTHYIYSVEPDSYFSLGNSGNNANGGSSGSIPNLSEDGVKELNDGDLGGVYFNREFAYDFYHCIDVQPRKNISSYSSNSSLTMKVTQEQIAKVVEYHKDYNYYKLFENNCVIVAANAWNLISTDHKLKIHTVPAFLKREIEKYEDSEVFFVLPIVYRYVD